jgi:hypothetical protein
MRLIVGLVCIAFSGFFAMLLWRYQMSGVEVAFFMLLLAIFFVLCAVYYELRQIREA